MAEKTLNDKQNLKLAKKALRNDDGVTALKYYLKAAENGNVLAMLDCGRMYFEGTLGVEKDIDKALEWFKKAGELRSAIAMNNIGYIYSTLGKYKEAVFWYEKAANLGDVISMLNLANDYLHNLNNEEKTHEWLKKAESLTDAYSIRKLADYYFQEDTIKNHIEKSISLYRKAISMGDNQAYKELGDLYFDLEDLGSAEKCYLDGANAGNADCMVNLGIISLHLPNCFEVSQHWLTKAARMGAPYAMKVLGELYKEYEDYPKARRWYRKAVLNGVEGAAEEFANFKKLMNKCKPNYKLRILTMNDI